MLLSLEVGNFIKCLAKIYVYCVNLSVSYHEKTQECHSKTLAVVEDKNFFPDSQTEIWIEDFIKNTVIC